MTYKNYNIGLITRNNCCKYKPQSGRRMYFYKFLQRHKTYNKPKNSCTTIPSDSLPRVCVANTLMLMHYNYFWFCNHAE